jgi:ATP-binding cassette subfamily B protein
MSTKFRYLLEAVKLVWASTPRWTTLNILISVLRSFLPLALLWLIRELIDGISGAVGTVNQPVDSRLLWLILLVIVTWFVEEAASDLGAYVRKKQSVRLESFMYDLLHRKSVKTDLINFEHPEYFDKLSRAVREAPSRPNIILNNLVSMLRGLLSLLLMAGLLFSFHWLAAILLLTVNIPAIWLRLHYAGLLYDFSRKQTPEARKAAYFNWLLTGDRPSRELRLFGLGEYFTGFFRKAFHATKDNELAILRKRTLIELFLDLFKAMAALVLILYIMRQAIRGELSLGETAMFLLAFRQGMVYLRELLASLAGLYEDSMFTGDIFEFLNLKESVKAPDEPAGLPPFERGLSVENLSFTYPGNREKTIEDIDLNINKGEVVALVGPNGAGKSTLVRLLARLYDPDSGSIRVDGTDIRNLEPEQYRKLLSVVFQDFMLYNLSAGENIRLGDTEKDEPGERIISSARVAGIHELISGLPKGYSTLIGNMFDESRELSWGEWQKLALARALFRDAPLLIMDEPSSALDADSEFEIFSSFREIMKGRTVILVSHRLTNTSLADRILVLVKGRIAESGSHNELMERKGIYFRMYSRQTDRFGK